MFALGWNIIRARLPWVITADWVDFLRSNSLPAMDAGVGMEGNMGAYTVRWGEYDVTFDEAELAPSTGLLNINYSRCVRS